jgi:DNA-binding transcriptional regulator YiaG
MYHYIESGLDYVWLANGYTVHKTEYGKGVSIENIEALQKTIALWIIDSPATMTGAEFRFLRMELDLSQRRIAELINAEEQAVRRWEKARNKPVKGSAERMMRVLFHAYSGGDAEIRHMIDKLATLDATPAPSKVVMRETDNKWRSQACC